MPSNPKVSLSVAMWCGSLALALLAGPGSAGEQAAGEWPQYYGADRMNISKETGWKAEFAEGGPKELWKINVGVGASSFTLRGGRLFTMGNVKDQDQVLCLEAATGKEIWKHTYACKLDKRSFEGGTACTPTLDGNRVYTVSHQGHLFCLDAEKGTVVWKKHFIDDLGGKRPTWGFACSPLVEKDLLIVDVGGKGSSTVALDKATGDVKWKNGDEIAGYSSPVAVDLDGKRTIIIFKGKALVGLDVSDGKELWRLEWKTDYDVNVAIPQVVGKTVFISSGYNRGCALLEIDGGKVKKLWENKNMRNHINGCVILGGHVYGFDGNVGGGKLSCIDMKDGSVAWSQGGMGTGMVTSADGKIIAIGEQGQLVITPAAPDGFKPTFKGKAMEGHCWVVPVLCDGRLYVRNNLGDVACLAMK